MQCNNYEVITEKCIKDPKHPVDCRHDTPLSCPKVRAEQPNPAKALEVFGTPDNSYFEKHHASA